MSAVTNVLMSSSRVAIRLARASDLYFVTWIFAKKQIFEFLAHSWHSRAPGPVPGAEPISHFSVFPCPVSHRIVISPVDSHWDQAISTPG